MNYIDVIIIILVLFFIFKGFSRGLVKEVVSVVSLFLGIYIASKFSVFLERGLNAWLSGYEEYISILSFLTVFLIVYLSLKFAGVVLSHITTTLRMGLLNKFFGSLFGAVKIILILSIVLFEINHLEENFGVMIPNKKKEGSFFYQKTHEVVPTIFPGIREKLKKTKTIDEKINKNIHQKKDPISQ